MNDDDLKILENFVILMYDRSSTAEGVDDARLDMFVRKQRSYEAIPPSHAALLQHVQRAAYTRRAAFGASRPKQYTNQKYR